MESRWNPHGIPAQKKDACSPNPHFTCCLIVMQASSLHFAQPKAKPVQELQATAQGTHQHAVRNQADHKRKGGGKAKPAAQTSACGFITEFVRQKAIAHFGRLVCMLRRTFSLEGEVAKKSQHSALVLCKVESVNGALRRACVTACACRCPC